MLTQLGIGVLLLAVTTQVWKALLAALGVKADGPWQDPLIWLYMLIAGMGGYVLHARLAAPLTGETFQTALGLGFVAISMALGQYHIVTHNYFNPSPDPSSDGKPAVLSIPLAPLASAVGHGIGDALAGSTAALAEPTGVVTIPPISTRSLASPDAQRFSKGGTSP